jgi:hypothetical protein
MSLWGNKDKVTVSGTYNISAAGVIGVTGATGFPSGAQPGDTVVVGTDEYIVRTISGSTGLTVFVNDLGATGAKAANTQTIYFQQKPKSLMDVDRKRTYGVDTVEMGSSGPLGFKGTPGPGHAGWVYARQQSGYVSEIILNTTGATGYNPAVLPRVSFSGGAGAGGASGVAVISPSGALTSITVLNGGVYTTSAPTVTIGSTGATGVVGTVVMGGRFNRKLYETLVAMSVTPDIMGDAENTFFPNV